MTRATSSRKNSTGSAVSSRPGPVFRGRDVVFVDPLDDKESYWWPAMIVPVPEIDSSMDCTVLNPGECLVKYFEDNKYSVVPFTDLQPFVPTTIPFLEFELAAGQKFLKNGGVVNAMAYLETRKVKRKFSWHRWGTAQDQELSLDMLKHKPVTLPTISDETFQGMQQHSQNGNSSSATSSPTTSTKNYTDSETDIRDNVSSTSSADEKAPQNPRNALKNGLQRSMAGIASQSSTLIPSPVSLNDPTTESMDETEFNTRSTRTGTATKDSPTASRSRSRRGSREVDTKASVAATYGFADKETSKRSRNVSEQSSSSSTSNANFQNVLATPSSSTSPTTGSMPSELTSVNETIKKRRTMPEQHVTTDIQNGVPESGLISARSSRQGSVEPSSSPRSTRHSFRNSKASENSQQNQAEDHPESPQESVAPTRLLTHRMTRQRSAPKSANSLISLPPPSPISPEKENYVKEEPVGEVPSKGPGEVSPQIVDQNSRSDDLATKSEDSASMDVDEQEPNMESNQREQSSSLIATSVSTASSASSPSSIGLEEGLTTSTSSLSSSNSGLIHTLEVERREMDYSFEHVLPTLAIGSKEREAFYESCMDHLQKLRQEHIRLKEILKSSDYVPKGRRATRSSPQQHGNHRNGHQHLEEKPNRRNSPVPAKSNSNGANGKEASGASAASLRSNLSNSSMSTSEESITITATTTLTQPVYQGSTPSSAILTSNISTTTRRSAATAAAAAVTATVSRASRQSYNNNNSNSNSSQPSSEKSLESNHTKKRGSTAAAAAAAAAAALAASDSSSAISTRAKRRQRSSVSAMKEPVPIRSLTVEDLKNLIDAHPRSHVSAKDDIELWRVAFSIIPKRSITLKKTEVPVELVDPSADIFSAVGDNQQEQTIHIIYTQRQF
ncbi:hypothetical protein BGX27_003100 [Mortierella sp. AM989]|nr:hypothetical protein BGX27_003100 [Mortierella sp. AM989]